MYDSPDYFEGKDQVRRGAYRDYDAQTAGTLQGIDLLLESMGPARGRSVLDVGCGYGAHLALAHRRGWTCFGVEPSRHARRVARDRLGSGALIVGELADLVPHEFDLILLLDVIEHLSDPYQLFFELYSKGAIRPQTQVLITTPNAGAWQARAQPEQWAYRTPPAHLVFYTAQSLERLLRTLHFSSVNIQGLYPEAGHPEQALEHCEGLRVQASGSSFAAFMQERYVPGTWSRIAEFEHLPRYRLAATLARGCRALDFGCGTGYGSAQLAQAGAQVTGLDIDAQAIAWAQTMHVAHQIDFRVSGDFGESLPAASFDLITCFEMIEHVAQADQHRTLASLSRLLKPGGCLLISTPNPAVTQRYGHNPFHLREMSLKEYLPFLRSHFEHVRLLRQSINVDIAFEDISEVIDAAGQPVAVDRKRPHPSILNRPEGPSDEGDDAVAWIALCSSEPLPESQWNLIDRSDVDYVGEAVDLQARLNRERTAVHEGLNRIHALEQQVAQLKHEVATARSAPNRPLFRRVGRLTRRVLATVSGRQSARP